VNARSLSRHAARAALIAALALASLAPAASAHVPRNGRIAFDHAIADGTQDILSIAPDGSHPIQLTHVPDGNGAESAAWDPTSNRVFFDSDIAGNIHLFAVNTNGDGLRQITDTDGFEMGARFSPDGRLVALEHDNADFTRGGVVLAQRLGQTLGPFRQLTLSRALAVGGFDAPGDFSPDATRLAFLRTLSTSRPTAQSAVFVIGTDGRGLHRVTPFSLNATLPRWSPDGTRLLFSSNGDNFTDQLSANVYTVRPDGTDLTQLTHESDGNHSFTPDWSPDGTKIVYAHATTGDDHTDLHVMDLATRRFTVIWNGAPDTSDFDLDWGPQR